jgi:hypothetical protein
VRMGWLFRRRSTGSRSPARDLHNLLCPNAPVLAGVGLLLKVSKDALIVKSVVEGSAAESAGIYPGDRVVEVDGHRLRGKGVSGATKYILGPIGSVAQIKLERLEGHSKKYKPLDVLVVRELKATVEPEYNLQPGSAHKKCTTQHLHLECLQRTTELGERKSEDEFQAVRNINTDKDLNIMSAEGSTESNITAGLGNLPPDSPSTNTPDEPRAVTSPQRKKQEQKTKSAERTVLFKGRYYAESEIEELEKNLRTLNEAMDAGGSEHQTQAQDKWNRNNGEEHESAVASLQNTILKMRRKSTDKWTRVRATVRSDGKLVLSAIVTNWLGVESPVKNCPELLSARCMWAGAVSTSYNPKMTARDFADMGRVLFVIIEDKSLLAHSRGGEVCAQQGTIIEMLAVSEEQRDSVVKALCVIAGNSGTGRNVAFQSPSAGRTLAVTKSISMPLSPTQEQKKTQPAGNGMPRSAENIRRSISFAFNAQSHHDGTASPGPSPRPSPAISALADNKDLAFTDAITEAPLLETLLVQAEQDPAPASAPEAMDDEEEDEMERLSGLAISRIARFEAQAQQQSRPTCVNLEQEWNKTAKKWTPGSSDAIPDKDPATCPATNNIAENTTASPACSSSRHEKTGVPLAAEVKESSSTSGAKDQAVSKGPSKAEKDAPQKPTPSKPARLAGGGKDLAALMEARRKAQEENGDDGYYF